MSPATNLNDKTSDQLKAEFRTAIHKILAIWEGIPSQEYPSPQEELDLSIWEAVAKEIANELKNRSVSCILLVVANG